jgi:hypothetical protein
VGVAVAEREVSEVGVRGRVGVCSGTLGEGGGVFSKGASQAVRNKLRQKKREMKVIGREGMGIFYYNPDSVFSLSLW